MMRSRPIPILMYHNIATPPPGAHVTSLYVPSERFATQMRTLRRLRVRGLSMSQAMTYLRGERSGRVVAITLDDGYADNFENALPILAKNGFSATCYVASAQVGGYNTWDAERLNVKKPLMSRDQLREWVAAGMEVGAHSRTHPHLTELPAEVMREEVHGCKAELEDLVGREVRHFCYPYGSRDAGIVSEVRAAGFESATCIRRAKARPKDDPYLLPRLGVAEGDSLARFLVRLLTPYEEYRAWRVARGLRSTPVR